METIVIIGWTASLASTISFLPQVIQTWKTRNTKDLSLMMYSIFVVAVMLWSIYGLMIKSLPMVITNTTIFFMASIILIFKLKHG